MLPPSAKLCQPRAITESTSFHVLLLEGDFLDLMRSSKGKSLDANLGKKVRGGEKKRALDTASSGATGR